LTGAGRAEKELVESETAKEGNGVGVRASPPLSTFYSLFSRFLFAPFSTEKRGDFVGFLMRRNVVLIVLRLTSRVVLLGGSYHLIYNENYGIQISPVKRAQR